MDKVIETKQLIDELDMNLYKYLDIHHTWLPNHTSFNGDNHLRLQESMRNYHINTRGWRDIAQHVSLAPDGLYITGRDFSWTPVSIRSDLNKDAFMVEMIGNFDIGHDILDGEQLNSILLLIRHFLDNDKKIRFHNEYSDKSCPGSSLDKEEMIRMSNNLPQKKEVTDEVAYRTQMYEDWQLKYAEDAIKELADEGIITNPKQHIDKLNKGWVEPWLFWLVTNKIYKNLNDKIEKLEE